MNKVILVGRLTADPELRQTASGVASCRFTVAVDRKFADKETGKREADFIKCVAWRQTAEFIAKYFTRGKMICVEGEMRNSSYKDKNHYDVIHYVTEVYVDNAEFCGGKNDNSNPAPAASAPQATTNLDEFEEIISSPDIPF